MLRLSTLDPLDIKRIKLIQATARTTPLAHGSEKYQFSVVSNMGKRPHPHVCTQPDCAWVNPDPAAWSRQFLVSVPTWVDAEFDKLMETFDLLVAGKRSAAVAKFREIHGPGLDHWVWEHIDNGNEIGARRRKLLDERDTRRTVKRVAAKLLVLGPKVEDLRPAKQERFFDDDAHTCRFHGTRLVAKEVLKRLANDPDFRPLGNVDAGGKVEYWHGVARAFRPSYDHVKPKGWGGTNDAHNIVTACYVCQFGRMEDRLEDVDLENPRNANRRVSGWMGRKDVLPFLAPLPSKSRVKEA